MKEATLHVHVVAEHGGRYIEEEYVYENALFSEEDLTSNVEMDDGDIKKGKLAVEVRAPSMLGATERANLPDGYHRCRLAHGDSELISGAIHGWFGVTNGAGSGPGHYEWELTLEPQATEDFLLRLEEEALGDLLPSLQEGTDYEVIPVLTPTAEEEEEPPIQMPFYDAERLFERLVASMSGVTLESFPPDLFTAEVRYPDSDSEPQTITRASRALLGSGLSGGVEAGDVVSGTLPAWSGRDLWGFFQAAADVRLRCRYEEYPGTAMAVHVLRGGWQDAQGDLPELPPAEDGYTHSTKEAGEPDLVIRFQNEKRQRRSYDRMDGGPVDHDVDFTQPLLPALRSAWRGDDDDAQAVRIPATLPRIVFRGNGVFEDGAYYEGIEHGLPVVEPGTDAVYLVEPFEGHAVRRRSPVSGRDGAPPAYGVLWASELLRSHALRVVPRDVLNGTFDAHGLTEALAVGEAEKGISLNGRSYMIERLDLNHDKEVVDLTAVRPRLGRLGAASFPTAAPASLVLYISSDSTGSTVNTRRWLTWEDPPIGPPPSGYEVQARKVVGYEDDDFINGDPIYGDWFSSDGRTYSEQSGSSLSWEDEGGSQFRVRSLYGWGQPSDWKRPTRVDLGGGL